MTAGKFINREQELESLNCWWKENKAHLIVCYGKRRVGKTELLKHFLKEKKGIYYLADQRHESQQLADLGKRIGLFFKDIVLQNTGFKDWLDLFSYLYTKRKEKFLFIIDELPYLISMNPAIVSLFQKGWDNYLKNTQILFILCGSSISMMERTVLSYKAPLYGRRSGQIMLSPLNFSQAHQFYPNMTFGEFLRLYSITGGMPAYLCEYEKGLSLEEFVTKKIFYRSAYLFRELDFLIKEELREPQNYLSILQSIAQGRNRIGEIANTTGLPVNIISKYLGVLTNLQFISREIPPTVKNPSRYRKGLYILQDQFIKFWFKYGASFKSDLELGQMQGAVSAWKNSFEKMVCESYQRLSGDLVRYEVNAIGHFERLGRFWERDTEIDLVGINEEKNTILFGEAKWSRQEVGINIYRDLQTKAGKVSWGRVKRREIFCLFSKSGFTNDMVETAVKEKVFLFHGNKLLSL